MKTHQILKAEMPYKVRASEEPRDGLATLDVSKLTIKWANALKPLPEPATFSLGTTFSDHMVVAMFNPTSGWSAPEIRPYGPLLLEPCLSSFQCGYSVFEGMKACLGRDGKVRLFRPELNMRRMERSVARMGLPAIDGDVVLELVKHLVKIDRRWIPTLPGYSLYLRPTIVAIGTSTSNHALLYIIACPSGHYWSRPVSLLAVGDTVRACPRNSGAHKVGNNYTPRFLPQRVVAAQGYDHVLWLFGHDRRITGVGAMNVIVVVRLADGDGLDVVTPPLDGTIRPGVARAACLELVSDPAFQTTVFACSSSSSSSSSSPSSSARTETRVKTMLHPTECTFTIADLARWSAEGDLLEFLCVGTAVVVTAVHRIGFEGRVVARVPTYPSDPNGLGPVGSKLRERILAVQEGREEYDGWGVVCG